MSLQPFPCSVPTYFPNGAVGWGSSHPADCLGPYARVNNCPVVGQPRRYTCYAQGLADSFFTIPAATRIRGRYIRGYFAQDDDHGGPVFHPLIPVPSAPQEPPMSSPPACFILIRQPKRGPAIIDACATPAAVLARLPADTHPAGPFSQYYGCFPVEPAPADGSSILIYHKPLL